ncbi:hypothetical protein JHN49_04500 [Streptomyces sp. MBT57]|nr:hypothetical protein [Streptomyces sp. MBT57]
MTALRHPECTPENCEACRKLFAVSVEFHQAAPDVPPTVAMRGAACGLSERMTRLHLAHLVLHCRLSEDRRTPVPGATVGHTGELPDGIVTPKDWAAAVIVTCQTCRFILTELVVESRGSWRGQLSMAELTVRTAKRAGKLKLSERTVRIHTRTGHKEKRVGHSLVGDGLVAFVADGAITGTGREGRKQYIRRPDRFILWPTEHREPVGLREGETWGEDRAVQMLDAVQWFDPTHPQAAWVMRLVAARVQEGWTEREVIVRLDVTPRTELPLRRPYLFAKRRLEGPLPPRPTPEVVPVAAAARSEVRPTIETCRWCCDPIGRYPERHTECEELWGPALPIAVERVERPRCAECSNEVGPAQWLCDGCGADQRISA